MSETACPAGAKVVDWFDHNSKAYVTERYDWFEKIRNEVGPVFWSPNHGGFWVALDYAEVTDAARDWETFSSRPFGWQPPEGTDISYNGLFIPPRGARNMRPGDVPRGASRLLQEDPPDWNVARNAINPLFSALQAEKWRGRIQTVVDACIDRRIESGRIDIAQDITNILPPIFSLELAGLTAKDYAEVGEISHVSSHLPADDPGWDEIQKLQAKVDLNGRIMAAIEARRNDRRGDVISTMLNAIDAGAPYDDADVVGFTGLIISAGIDTTSATLGTTFMNLMQHPKLLERLKAEPEITRYAFDEFLRIGAPTQGLCRTVVKDTELGGQQLRRGDRIMLMWSAANRDAKEYPCPLEIDLDRRPTLQVGFGFGNHRCLGMHYARLEFEIVFNTVLRRMPDIRIETDKAEQYDNCGVVMGWKSLPATFTPGPRLGVDPEIPGWPS